MNKSLKIMLVIMMMWNTVSVVLGILNINIPELISITASVITIFMGICIIWNTQEKNHNKKSNIKFSYKERNEINHE